MTDDTLIEDLYGDLLSNTSSLEASHQGPADDQSSTGAFDEPYALDATQESQEENASAAVTRSVGQAGESIYAIQRDQGDGTIGTFVSGRDVVHLTQDNAVLMGIETSNGHSVLLLNSGERITVHGTVALSDVRGTIDTALLEADTPTAPAGEYFAGTDGDDEIDGGDGDDELDGGAGDDALWGGLGNDTITTGGGADIIYFSRDIGDDTITDFASGQDRIVLYGDSTVLVNIERENGWTRLILNSGDVLHVHGAVALSDIEGMFDPSLADETIVGGDGPDTLFGGGGNDTLLGGDGDDLLDGGSGDDVLEGGAGDDVITTGAGSDTVMWGRDIGNDTVTDFESGSDRIVIQGETAIVTAIQEADGVTTISLNSGNTLTVEGSVALSDIQAILDPSLGGAPPPAGGGGGGGAPPPAGPPPIPTLMPTDTDPAMPGDADIDISRAVFDWSRVVGNGTGGNADTPSVGLNLHAPLDHNNSVPFLDIFKTARFWSPTDMDGQQGGDLTFDQNGWVTGFGANTGQALSVVMGDPWSDGNAYTAGRYVVEYEGQADITLHAIPQDRDYFGNPNSGELPTGDLAIQIVEQTPGRIVFDYTPGDGMILLAIQNNGNFDAANPPRNIQLFDERYEPLIDAGEIFDPDFLDRVEDAKTLRFMDWMNTNWLAPEWGAAGSPPLVDYYTPADMNTLDSAFWTAGRGIPVQVMVELANKTGIDPWFNIPFGASDEYIQQFATYVRDNLEPGLRAKFEYANEIWNFQFAAAHEAQRLGVEMLGPDAYLPHIQYAAFDASRMARILDQVWGDDPNNQLVKVLGGWTGGDELVNRYLLEAPDIAALGHEPPYLVGFDELAITSYFANDFAGMPEIIAQWMQDADGGFARAIEHMRFGNQIDVLPYNNQTYLDSNGNGVVDLGDVDLNGDGVIQPWEQNIPTEQQFVADGLSQMSHRVYVLADLARQFGMQLSAYEGNNHITPGWASNFDLNDPMWQQAYTFLEELLQRPEMGELMAEMLSVWRQAGGGELAVFSDIGSFSPYGEFGLMNNRYDTAAPDKLAFDRFNAENGIWWGDYRGAEVFRNDELIVDDGSRSELNGGAGDDLFFLLTDQVTRIRGGAGGDTVLLTGNRADYTVTALVDGSGVQITRNDGTLDVLAEDIETVNFGGDDIFTV